MAKKSPHDWYYTGAEKGTFRDIVHNLRQEAKGNIVDDWRTDAQKPMKQRKAELLAKIQKRGPGGLGTHKSIAFYEPVLSKLVKDGDVVLKRIIHRRGFHGTNSTSMVATWFPEVVEEEVREPHAKKKAALKEAGLRVPGENQGKEKTETRVINWTKKKNDQLLFDSLKGEADPDVIKEVNRTKTKFRKMRITKDE